MSSVPNHSPIPQFQRDPRGLFVDRWGTLLVEPSRGYCTKPEDLEFIPGAVDALYRAHRAGWLLYLIGNEGQVWKGKQSAGSWEKLQAAITSRLEDQGVVLRRFYACLDHPEGVKGHQNDSVFRLPNTGAFYQAAHVDGVELRRSWVLGDSTLELVAGWRAGLQVAGVLTGQGLRDGRYEVDPAFAATDLDAAISILLGAEGARVG